MTYTNNMYRTADLDASLRVTTALIDSIDKIMEQLLSFLPSSAKQLSEAVKGSCATDLEVQQAIDEVLEYHRTHRPKNTTKNYLPKQREWKVSYNPLYLVLQNTNYSILQAWCEKKGFAEGGKYLPGDYVDEGKLLLFIKEEVASRPPRRGSRLEAERQRKRQAALTLEPKLSKRRRGFASQLSSADNLAIEGEDDESCSDLVLMYNTVRGYCSAVNKLWAHQTSMGLHLADQPQRVALTALKTAIVRGEHQHRWDEFVDRGLATIRDGYTASQIPDLTQKVWQQSLGANCIDQQFRTQLCFLFGNSMLLRLSNRLPMELPDLFSMPLPREGPKGDGWCLVTVMDQGKTILHCFSLSFLLSTDFCIVFHTFTEFYSKLC